MFTITCPQCRARLALPVAQCPPYYETQPAVCRGCKAKLVLIGYPPDVGGVNAMTTARFLANQFNIELTFERHRLGRLRGDPLLWPPPI